MLLFGTLGVVCLKCWGKRKCIMNGVKFLVCIRGLEDMNVMYCGDKNIAEGLIISVMSLVKQVKEELHIYVLTMYYVDDDRVCEPLDNDIVRNLQTYIRAYNEKSTVKLIDVSRLFDEEMPLANMGTRFTPCCMLRLYADRVEELPDRLMYLDTDVICRMDCKDFYYQDIEECELIGVLDNYGKWFFRRNPFRMDYLNSGVLLMNLKKMRETGLLEKCRKRCAVKKMFMPDQSALNKLATKKRYVPRRFNEQQRLRNDTVFQHFTTRILLLPKPHIQTVKPWHMDKLHSVLKLHEYDELLMEYESIRCEMISGEAKRSER